MQLNGQKRQILGKKIKQLRENNTLPAVIFGKGLESLPIEITYIDFVRVFRKAGETDVIDLMIDAKTHPVLIKEVQHDPITSKLTHVGFYQVNLKEKINADIPVDVINEELNELIKSGQAIVLLTVNELEVEALPNDLPHNFVIDATKLIDMDSVITVADLDYDKEKVEITSADPTDVIAKLDYAVMKETEEEAKEEVDEAAAIAGLEASKEKVEEGEEEAEKDEKE